MSDTKTPDDPRVTGPNAVVGRPVDRCVVVDTESSERCVLRRGHEGQCGAWMFVNFGPVVRIVT